MPKSLDEIRVAELFVQKGHKIIATNVRLAGVEVDLIVQTPQKEIWFIEVKSPFWPKVSRKQKYRQKNCFLGCLNLLPIKFFVITW